MPINTLYKQTIYLLIISMKPIFILAVLVISCSCIRVTIDSYGALRNKDYLGAHLVNQKAIRDAIKAVNQSSDTVKQVVIPAGKYYSMPILTQYVDNLTLIVLGKLSASKNCLHWDDLSKGQKMHFLTFINCNNLEVRGGGTIDGRGYHWWIIFLLGMQRYLDYNSSRPHLIWVYKSINVSFHDIILKNSPQYHLKLDEVLNGKIYNMNIRVNTTAQLNLLKSFSLVGIIPMFPFNTDGVDPHGSNFHIYNLTVQNWDDVVVPKPGVRGDLNGDCTENFLVQNITVALGVGVTIGSVPPDLRTNCIRNVTFQNVKMHWPWKGIYVKTNPGDEGDGIVENIWYENVTMQAPHWWAIYIGPQQMKEPDGDGPGCMFYPFDRKGQCTTQPRITMRNITLKNVMINNSFFFPVVIRCNETNPCTDFLFDNVTTDKWHHGQKEKGVVCEFASGTQRLCSPKIYCFKEGETQNLKSEPQTHGMDPEDLANEFMSSGNAELWNRLYQAVRQNPYTDEYDDQMAGFEEFVEQVTGRKFHMELMI